MKKSTSRYSPRTGSKVAEAIDALSNGPLTPKELAHALQRDSSAINTLLLRALTHGAIVKVKNRRGRIYFATPDTVLDEQFIATHRNESGIADTDTAPKQNIHQLQIAASEKAATLVSSNVRSMTAHENSPAPSTEHIDVPSPSFDSKSPPVIAGLFSDGELTISIGGECLQLDTSQRQQLYAYLHKIRYLE